MESTLTEKSSALAESQARLEKLIQLGIAMSAERDSAKLMEMILLGAKDLANADGGTLYMRTDDDQLVFQIIRNDTLGIALGGTIAAPPNLPSVPMYRPNTGEANHNNVVSHAVHEQTTVNIPDAYASKDFDFSGTRAFDSINQYRSTSFLTVPLKPRGGDVIGALQLINARGAQPGEIIPFSDDIQRFVEALAAQAATAMYNRSLLDAQEKLMDALIQIIAGAIDAKSPYTGGHCERVPELAMMLARAACEENNGPLAKFQFSSEEEWREFRIGAWLHDCGKVTMPEYVVDKATKLETIYNRVHEVRTRFEVLLRDAEIERLNRLLNGEAPAEAQAAFEARKAQLHDDFTFLAECNVGGEFMAPELVERVKKISGTTWTRHFSDRLGLGHEELRRFGNAPEPPLPVVETLLSDKPEHIIFRSENENVYDERYKFRIRVPPYRFNFGEVYNLSISRGTLTDEERYKINEHIIQTVIMLEKMPFPKNMRRIPEYACTHHETMIGTGYPRKLSKEDMSIPARIMAIADIFEALTASDRPYKKAKPLSEAIRILSFFKKDQHIDSDLFDLFLKNGIYADYAKKYLKPEQIDEVDITKYLG
ncbi:Diguanylate cyclase [Azospirillaceae bacterium]